MSSCPFCAIAADEDDAYRLYEDADTVAFFDTDPATPGHTLIIPKPHHEHLFTDDPSIAAAVFDTVRTVSNGISELFDPDGISLFYTSADLIGNVEHAHVHLVPRYEDDDIHLALPRNDISESDMQRLAAHLRDILAPLQ